MSIASTEFLAEQLALADELREGRDRMLEPQDLPGRYGRVVKSLDRVLQAIRCEAVIGGGWAVWRHGFIGRVTQDVDIVLAADQVDSFLRAASVSGFDAFPQAAARWPKIVHKDTGITVDILPEGQTPGTPSRPAPTKLPHPSTVGGAGFELRYITLPALIELKLAAGRAKDDSDIVELIRANAGEVDALRAHLRAIHTTYLSRFDQLLDRAREQEDR